MERIVYQQMAELDDRHWWYRARRRVLAELIRREVRPPASARILELGCGTAYFGAWLKKHGAKRVLGVDITPAQLDTAREMNEMP